MAPSRWIVRIFFGRKYAHRTARSWVADATLRRLISFRVEAYAEPRKAIADAGSHLCVVFPDAAGKDQQSGPIECGDHACHMFANRVTEHLNCQPGVGVGRRGFMQAPHVAVDSGNSEEAGVMIDEGFETRGVEVLFPQQIDQDARIEIATARSHDRPSGRGQAHAGIDGLAVFDGGNTDAIAQMRNDQPIRPIIPKLPHDRLAGKAMKPIALNAARPQVPRDRQRPRDIRHPGMKCRIEAGDLW